MIAPIAPILSEDGATALVPLVAYDGTVKGHALIDAADAEWAGQWRWHLNRKGYAARIIGKGAQMSVVLLHRALLGLVKGDGLEADHIDRNKLNCRRDNLRVLPKGKNQQNLPVRQGATSKFRGVCWDKRRGAWMAYISFAHKLKTLGHYTDEAEAGAVAMKARARLMPYATD